VEAAAVYAADEAAALARPADAQQMTAAAAA
jgi:hypothetical protein